MEEREAGVGVVSTGTAAATMEAIEPDTTGAPVVVEFDDAEHTKTGQ